MADSRIGTVLDDRYQILDRIGAGGMGVVYRGERLKLGRSVAIKFLHGWMAQDSSFLKRFEIEAKAMAKLQHPNCMSVIDYGVDGDEPYVVMDLATGESLRTLLDKGRLPVASTIEIVRQLLAGLAHAHSQGITHRDIKPDNIMVDSSSDFREQVRILDFGLAKMREASTGLTSGFVVGTPAYMAPEQTLAQPVDARTDVYAVGVVLFEMLAGQKPFQGDDAIEIIRMHREEPPPPPGRLVPEAHLSAEIEEVVARALAKAPEDRYLTAAEFAVALDATPEAAQSLAAARDSARQRARSDAAERMGTAATALIDSNALIPVDTAVSPGKAPVATPSAGQDSGTSLGAALTTPLPVEVPGPDPAPSSALTTPLPVEVPGPDPAPSSALTTPLPVEAPGPAHGTPVPGSQPGPVAAPTLPGHEPGQRRSRRGLMMVAAVVAVALVAVAATMGSQESAENPATENAAVPPVQAATMAEPDAPSNPPTTPEPPEAEPETPPDNEPEGAAKSTDSAPEPPELTKIKAAIQAGRTRGLTKELEKLQRKYRDNGEIPYILGQLYFGKLWVVDGLEAFREAIARDPSYREDATLIKSAIIGLANEKYHTRVRSFLVRDIGKPAAPHLQEAATNHQSVKIRERAARALSQLR